MTTETLKRAQIIRVDYNRYVGETDGRVVFLELSGRFHYQALAKTDYPAVGDWVSFRFTDADKGIVERIEERRSVLQRLARTNVHDAQILATNVDVAFLCISCNKDYHPTKLKNLITMSHAEGIEQIVLLTKTDLADDLEAYRVSTDDITDLPVMTASIFDDQSIAALQDRIGLSTCVFLGASGVGKSSLVNRILGEEYLATKDIRQSDAQGRHTTTHRELIRMPQGGAIIDTPGMRVMEQYSVDDLEDLFEDIADYAANCRFRDCSHTNEPGCQVQEAIEEGDLPVDRLDQYKKALRVNAHVKMREAEKNRILEKRQYRR